MQRAIFILVLGFVSSELVNIGKEKYDEDCAVKVSGCNDLARPFSANEGNATENKCSRMLHALHCLRYVPRCVSDVEFMIRFRVAQSLTAGWNLGNTSCSDQMQSVFFDGTDDEPCSYSRLICLITYVDTLKHVSLEPGDTGQCQALVDYVHCLRRGVEGCPEKQLMADTDLQKLVRVEMARMKTPDCVVPGLKANLSIQECSTATEQCLSINDYVPDDNIYCEKTQEAIKCVQNLGCHSPVSVTMLLLLEKRDDGLETCESSNYSLITKPSLSSKCRSKMDACVIDYANTLLAPDAAKSKEDLRTEMCGKLSAYSKCLFTRGELCGADTAEVQALVDMEKQRLKLYSCKRSKVVRSGQVRVTVEMTAIFEALILGCLATYTSL